ncbi:hypothetical protein KPH14_011602 [Odynerus spinipes]|uniref:Endonuclease/exonuclease/phosphatase domain-containing protein n=1 Tax=Odynerus spinipes TaxID=1348599 RepID=A0AAD9RDL7_9HYME|nr:hypothetical protein KPH14_011602 [Odynerus spinipes]
MQSQSARASVVASTSRTSSLLQSTQEAPLATDQISNTELLRALNARFVEISAQIRALPAMQAQIEANSARISDLEEGNKQLRDNIVQFQRQLDADSREHSRLLARQSGAELIILGAPCPSEEMLLEVAQSVATLVGLTLENNDVTEIRFLVPQSKARREDAPLPILIKLRSRDLARKLISAKRAKGRLRSSDLQLSSGVVVDRITSIFVNEALPRDLHQLLKSVKSVARVHAYKYVWHRDGAILLRKSDGAKIERIYSISDLRDLEARQNPGVSSVAQSNSLRDSSRQSASLNLSQTHIIAVSETWLHAGAPDATVLLPGYSILRNDREGKTGGGVALYIHETLSAKLLASSPQHYSNAPKYLFVEIKQAGSYPLLVAIVYRPPKATNLTAFSSDYDRFVIDYSSIVILGDFNANQLGHSYEAIDLRNFFPSVPYIWYRSHPRVTRMHQIPCLISAYLVIVILSVLMVNPLHHSLPVMI